MLLFYAIASIYQNQLLLCFNDIVLEQRASQLVQLLATRSDDFEIETP